MEYIDTLKEELSVILKKKEKNPENRVLKKWAKQCRRDIAVIERKLRNSVIKRK